MTQKICSLDKFAYGHFHRSADNDDDLPQNWSLLSSDGEDLKMFNAFYHRESGGLMTRAFDITEEKNRFDDLAEEYRNIGFQRERRIVSLKHEGRLKIVLEVNQADMGLNMSDLTNCIRLFVMDNRNLYKEIVVTAVNRLAQAFTATEVPVMVFPANETTISPVPTDRHYLLWIYNLRHTDSYFSFINRIIRFSRAADRPLNRQIHHRVYSLDCFLPRQQSKGA